MDSTHKFSFISLLSFLFIFPLFFVSGSFLPLVVSKAAFLALGVVVITLLFLYETMRVGKIALPSTYILWGALALPIIYLLSALASPFGKFGMFGYNLEMGTFVSILFASSLFIISAIVFNQNSRIMEAFGLTIVSLSLVLLFGVVQVISMGKFIQTGVVGGVTGNPIGSWTDYATIFGLVIIISLFALEMLSMRKVLRSILYAFLVGSLFILAVINFSTAWQLVLGASIISLVYFLAFEKKIGHASGESRRRFILPVVLVLISFLFVLNPTVSTTKGNLGSIMSETFKVNNIDVRPSFGTTLDIGSRTLKAHPLLGSGPNTFVYDWLLHKPLEINATNFWNTAFPYGIGFLPTQIATVGIFGSLLWIVFMGYFIFLGVKTMSQLPEGKGARFVVTATFVTSLFLWVAHFFYQPSLVLFVLTFVFTGVFVGALHANGVLKTREIVFGTKPTYNFVAILCTVVLGIGAIGVAYLSFERIASVIYFQKALRLSSVEGVDPQAVVTELGKAAALVPHDMYYQALSQLEFSRAQAVAMSTTGTAEQNRQVFEDAMSRSILAAQAAVNKDPHKYQNRLNLGAIYASLVPKPFSVPGAYENAKASYEAALLQNPLSPEVPLLLARLEVDKGNVGAAQTYIQAALQKKADYAEAYYLLTQLEVSQNRIPEAIKSVETATLLSPTNAGLYFQLGLLRYLNKEYQSAADALSKALTLVPEYANAKYYLGLSYDQLDRRPEAVQLFEELQVLNPENEIVNKILTNLKANQDAFYQSVSNKAPSKTTPPIPSARNAGGHQ